MKHRRIRRRFVIGAAIALLVTALGGTWAAGYVLSQPARARIGAPPHDLAAETVCIRLENGSYEVGWLIRGMKGRGLYCSCTPCTVTGAPWLDARAFCSGPAIPCC